MFASRYVQQYCSRRLRRTAVSLLAWSVLAGFTVFFAASMADTLDGHTEVTATATAETTTKQTVGSRRSKRIEDVPALRIEYDHRGERQETTIAADDRRVGDVFPVYVSEDDGAVTAERPAVGVMDWVILGALLLVGVPWVWISVAGAVRTSRIRGFDPDQAAEGFTLAVQALTPRTSGKVEYLKATGVVASGNATGELAAGKRVGLESYASAMPPAQQFPARLEARLVPVGGITRTVFVRSSGTADWWVASVVVDAPAQQAAAH